MARVFVGGGQADADAALARGADDYLERRPERDDERRESYLRELTVDESESGGAAFEVRETA